MLTGCLPSTPDIVTYQKGMILRHASSICHAHAVRLRSLTIGGAVATCPKRNRPTVDKGVYETADCLSNSAGSSVTRYIRGMSEA